MVSLAKKYEGRPFHLIASHCQNDTQENVTAYIRSKGLPANTPNFTVTSQGRHPKVKGNGYVPYYIVFDHRGKLVQHHMCGDYHGGDGLGMVEWVDKLMKKVPDIYLGNEEFKAAPKMAEQVRAGKNLAGVLKKIASEKANDNTAPDRLAEIKRIETGITAWRDRSLLAIADDVASYPSKALSKLSDLSKALRGSELANKVDDQIAKTKSSADFKTALKIEKQLNKIEKSLDKLKACKNCKREGRKLRTESCSSCYQEQKMKIGSLNKKLTGLKDSAAELPIKARILALLSRAKVL